MMTNANLSGGACPLIIYTMTKNTETVFKNKINHILKEYGDNSVGWTQVYRTLGPLAIDFLLEHVNCNTYSQLMDIIYAEDPSLQNSTCL